MKHITKFISGALLLSAMIVLVACNSDSISGDSYYTFTGETVASYCESRPSTFSIFSKIIKESGEEALLSTYGHFTCFIPTDSAFNVYFAEKGISYESLTEEDKQNIVFNHIIRSVTLSYKTKDFTEGALGTTNMNNRYMVISYKSQVSGTNDIIVNKTAKITVPDIELHNGVVHVINTVLVPSDETLGSVLNDISKYSIFSKAYNLTNLNDSMSETYDMTYKDPYTTDLVNVLGYTMKALHQRRLGYTMFAEPESVFHAAGIDGLPQLIEYAKKYYGSEDLNDYTSRNNPLNKFISYHLLNRQMSTNSLIYSGNSTSASAMDKRYEYYETMLQNRLMEVKAGNKINMRADGTYVSINEGESNISGMNGFIHSLNNILVYDTDSMEQDVLNKRIRCDAYSVAPQLTNNNIRWKLLNLDGYSGYTVPPTYCGNYLKFNNASKVIMWASEYWTNYQADEISIRGWYDFTVRMLPVPPGTYEIRLGYRAETWRGIAQLFVDDQIVGIPVNLSYTGNEPTIGWVSDDATTDGGTENDKMMRNRGYMKAPNSIYSLNGPKTLRQDINSLRIIVGTFTFQNYGPHYFRAKNVESENGEFHLDYIEYVPVSYIDKEGKD